MSRQDLEQLFLSNLVAIDSILAGLTRRHGFSPGDAEEVAAWAKMRLIENDYSILAKFRGEAALTTYLLVVLAMLLQEYRVKEWGRWRPSAAAKKSGPIGVRLETLINRDGFPLAVAAEMLRTSGETTLSDRELADIAAKFPRRTSSRPKESGDSLDQVPAVDRADERVLAEFVEEETSTTHEALNKALETLPDEDRLLVRLHFMEAMSLAEISRGLSLPQKPLYRQLKRALGALRRTLERAGISRERVRELAADPP